MGRKLKPIDFLFLKKFLPEAYLVA